MSDRDAIVMSIEAECGPLVLARETDRSTIWGSESGQCLVQMQRDGFQIFFGDRVGDGGSLTALSIDSVALRGEDDVELLQRLGIAGGEILGSETVQVAARTFDESADAIRERYMGTKTFADRNIAGYRDPGSRAVVTRDYAGTLRKVLVVWPAVDSDAILSLSSSLDEDVGSHWLNSDETFISATQVAAVLPVGWSGEGDIVIGVRVLSVVRMDQPMDYVRSRFILDGKEFELPSPSVE